MLKLLNVVDVESVLLKLLIVMIVEAVESVDHHVEAVNNIVLDVESVTIDCC